MALLRRSWRPWFLTLGAVVLLGLGLRMFALDYGLPAVYNPDESPILNRALAFAKGDPNPHNFLYPSLYFYALFAWETLFFLAGRAVGLFASLAAFQREFFVDPSRLFLAGRAFTAVCGSLTVIALYGFGKRLYGRAAGIAAALFYAVSPLAARDAHYVKLDVPVTLMVVLTHAALARIVADPDAAGRRRAWLVAGLLGGLAISTHYYVGLIVFSFVVVAVADLPRSGRWQESFRLLLWAALGVVAGFFAGTPFMIVEPHIAIRDIVAVREIDVDRAVVAGAFVSLRAYLEMLFRDGWAVCLAGAVGAAWALVADWRRGLLLVTFPVLFLAFVANTVPMTRYLNAMLPSVALAGAFALTRLARTPSTWRTVATAALVVGAAIPGFVAAAQTDAFLAQVDTRTLAREYIERHIPPGSSILVQPYSAPLRPSRDALLEALRANLGNPERASIKYQLQLSVTPYPSPAYRLIYLGDRGEDVDKLYVSPRAFAGAQLAAVRQLGVEYVVLKRYESRDPGMQGLSAALAREGQLLATFSPYRPDARPAERAAVPPFLHNTALRLDPLLARPGPIVEVWRIP